MSDLLDSKAFFKLCELSVDNMYELEALGELLQEKGIITRQEILDRATSLKEKVHQTIPSSPEAQPITSTENAFIEQIMEVILQSGLSSQQAKALLERTITLLEWGEKAVPKTTH